MEKIVIPVKELEKKIKDLNKKIDFLQEDLEKLPKKVKNGFSESVNDLKKKRLALVDKIGGAKAKSHYIYDDLHSGVVMAWEDLNLAYQNAKERVEKEAS